MAPTTSTTFAGGDIIDVSATATDAAGRAILGSAMQWWVVLHHATHTHPVLSATPGSSGSFAISRKGHLESDIHLRVYVRAIDDRGRADTAFVDVYPRLITFTIATSPIGLEVLVDHQPLKTPVSFSGVIGMERDIGAPDMQALNGIEYEFSQWSNGGDEAQTILTPNQDIELVATFRERGVANLAPSVQLTSPTAASTLTSGASITLRAAASDGDGAIIVVDFFSGGTMIGRDSTYPYEWEWTPTGTGSRSLAARATDDDGAYTMSSPVGVVVKASGVGDVLPPIATLTSPVDRSRDLTGSINVAATASDDVGVIAVEFEVDGQRLATDVSSPYEAVLPSTAAFASGVHVIRARALDAAGNASDWSSATVTFGGTVALPDGFIRETMVSGFGDVLTAATYTPDGRLLVAEKSGSLRVVKDGLLLPQPFVELQVLDGGERGLLGVAIHPGFASNRYVFVYYTTGSGETAHNRISRFTASTDTALPGSEVILAELPALSDASKHNGGAMHFGADGKLYVAVGDDGDAANAPSLDIPFGKMLRFDADGGIPADNPFLATTTGLNRAIWARGLRNPFTFAIEGGTGRMYINDVGAGAWEEINAGRAGANYGWPATEGPTTDPAFDAPVFAYAHGNSPSLFDGSAIVGAAFYRPSIPSFGQEYLGRYFFADYVDGWIYSLDSNDSAAAYAFAHVGNFPTGLVVSDNGDLLVLAGRSIERLRRNGN